MPTGETPFEGIRIIENSILKYPFDINLLYFSTILRFKFKRFIVL